MDAKPVRKTAGLADSLDGKNRALTVVDIAELLNISQRQVYKLAAEYRIPCFKVGVAFASIPVQLPTLGRVHFVRHTVGVTSGGQCRTRTCDLLLVRQAL